MLEVDSLEVCQTGLTEEAELHWREDKQAALGPCQEIKHILQRTARDCPDVHFVHLDVSSYLLQLFLLISWDLRAQAHCDDVFF